MNDSVKVLATMGWIWVVILQVALHYNQTAWTYGVFGFAGLMCFVSALVFWDKKG